MNKLENYYRLVVPANLAEDEFVRIAAFKTKKDGTKIEKIFYIKSLEELEDIIHKYKYNWNLYISSSTVKNKDGGKFENLCRRQVVFLDFDKKDFPQYKDFRDFTAHIKRKLPMLFNHCAVDSGGGYHFYISVKPTKDTRRITQINKQLALLVGADMKAVKSTQIMRIPLSLNLKTEEPRPVSVISNVLGTSRFRPYEMNKLESIIRFARKNLEIDGIIQEQPKTDYSGYTSYYCVEKMINEGCEKGERNFCLGRIVKYLQDVKGYNEFNALQVVKDWNNRCRPIKNFDEVLSDFQFYWKNNYKLLGCTMPDVREQALLSKYCDRYNCKTILRGETRGVVEGRELKIDNHLLSNRIMKKLSGNHYLILTVLHINEDGLSLEQLKQSITTPKTGKPCLDHRTLNKVLDDLVYCTYVSCENKFYKLIDIKNYGLGFTRYFYSVTLLLINKVITSQQYLVYLALIRNLQQNRNVSYNTLADDLDMDVKNVGKYVRALHKNHVLKIEKIYNEKGLLANKYVLTA